MNVEGKIKNILSRVLGIDANKITDNLNMDNTPEWDSLSTMLIVAQLEDDFSIELTVEEIIQMSSFFSLREIVEKRFITES